MSERSRERERERVIDLIGVNTYAQIVMEKLEGEGELTDKFNEIINSLESKLADKQEVLSKLESRATEIGSDNLWNKYESASEAYGYGGELKSLLSDYLCGYEDKEGLEWQVADLVKKSGSELLYRLERAQW